MGRLQKSDSLILEIAKYKIYLVTFSLLMGAACDPGTLNYRQPQKEGGIQLVEDDLTFAFVVPQENDEYVLGKTIRLQVKTSASKIVKVIYSIDEQNIGSSVNPDSGFAIEATLSQLGALTIVGIGLDGDQRQRARAEVHFSVTDLSVEKPPQPENPDSKKGEGDPELAEKVASTARQGQAGGSLGRCWEYVWRAMIKSGLTTEDGGNALGNAGPCSMSQFNASAYCFRRNADANPDILYQYFHLQKLDSAPADAPRGAVISWDKGCMGFNASHGHIEIAQGDGSACSDFCGTIVKGGESCASVYIPIF